MMALISEEEEEYVVEKIVDKRTNPTTGNVEYLLKLQGRDQKDSIWELKENLSNCPKIIAEFESNGVQENIKSKKRKFESTATSSDVKQKKKKLSRLERGLAPESIIGVTKETGQLMFLLKWPDTDDVDLMLAQEANVKFPDIVIDFYEKHLVWDDSNQEK